MDSGHGNFKEVTDSEVETFKEAKAKNFLDRRIDKVFRVGEELQIKASMFRVRHIDFLTGIMVIKLLPTK
jgi:hypothetical protein